MDTANTAKPARHSAPADRTCLTPEQRQAITRVLADPRRFEILEQIAANETTFCTQLHAQECISPATISHHLKELQEAGLVDAERQGRQMCLRLCRPVWEAYVRSLQAL